MLFGRQDKLTCIQPFTLKGLNDEPRCLAYKTSSWFFVGDLYLSDQGYVLRLQQDETRFFELSAERTAELQETGKLPRPCPGYSVPFIEYAFRYSLCIAVVAVAVWGLIEHYRKQRRLVEDAAAATTFGPPLLRTDTDRWLDQQVRPLLRPEETVQHQAYTFPGSTADGAIMTTGTYVVLTTERLFLFTTRVGAFGPLHDTSTTEIIDRRQVVGVQVDDDRVISMVLDDGSARRMWAVGTGRASNQRAFERDVPRILGGIGRGVASCCPCLASEIG